MYILSCKDNINLNFLKFLPVSLRIFSWLEMKKNKWCMFWVSFVGKCVCHCWVVLAAWCDCPNNGWWNKVLSCNFHLSFWSEVNTPQWHANRIPCLSNYDRILFAWGFPTLPPPTSIFSFSDPDDWSDFTASKCRCNNSVSDKRKSLVTETAATAPEPREALAGLILHCEAHDNLSLPCCS